MLLSMIQLQVKVESWNEPWKSHGKTLLRDAYSDLITWKDLSQLIIEDVTNAILATEEEMKESRE